MPHEIMDQFLHLESVMERRVTHIVFMGMGEPLLNLASVSKSIQLLSQKISARNITVSSVGVKGAIREAVTSFSKPVTLAISLHAGSQSLRESILPSAKAYLLPQLFADIRYYFQHTKRRISFEYCLLQNVNLINSPL